MRPTRSPLSRFIIRALSVLVAFLFVIGGWFSQRVATPLGKAPLSDSRALTAILEGVLRESAPRAPNERVTDEQRKLFLEEHAKDRGFERGDVDQTIRALGETEADPYLRGLAALYEENYPEATRLLSDSLRQRQQGGQTSTTLEAVSEVAFFLGQSLFQEGDYLRATEVFKLVVDRRAADSDVLNSLGLCLHKVGDYAEAEQAYTQSLQMRQEKLGPDHPEVA